MLFPPWASKCDFTSTSELLSGSKDNDCLKKKFSIKVKKKSKKKGRWPSRRIKTWYIYNNNIVFLFMKKLFSYLDFSGRYGHFNV